MIKRSLKVAVAASFLLGSLYPAGVHAAQGPQAPIAVPPDGVIRLTDYGMRDWGPELVHYRIDTGKFKPGHLALIGDDGSAVPFQIEKTDGAEELAFVATVAKGKSATYTLRAGPDRSAENSTITDRSSGNAVEVGNASYTLRLPPTGRQSFKTPVSIDSVPAPILGWKQAGFDWMGSAHFVTDRKLAAYSMERIESGPASIVYRARYDFAPRGEYVWQVRVTSGVPVAIVTEEFDFGEQTQGSDFLLLSLGDKWKPQQISFEKTNGIFTNYTYQPLADLLAAKAADQQKVISNIAEIPAPPRPSPETGLLPLGEIGFWSPQLGLALSGAPAPAAGSSAPPADGPVVPADAPSVSMSPYNLGSWRRAMAVPMWNDPVRGAELALPISVHPLRWNLDFTDDSSYFSSQEHDNSLPDSYGRRVWGMGFGLPNILKTRITLGYLSLDRYKDWVTDWPEDKKVVYPRAYTTPATVAKLREALGRDAEKPLLEKLYMFNGKPETAIANAKLVIDRFSHNYTTDWSALGLTQYIQAYTYTYTVYADDALSCPTLPVDLRHDLRRTLALGAYLASEPDYNPRGAGFHLGNNNMPIGRTLMLMQFAPLLPDHPMYEYWMSQLKNYTQWKLATMASPDGAWLEPPTYQFYGPARSLAVAQEILRNTGWGDLTKLGYESRVMEYDANLTMPDARFKGWRIFPGMGNSGDTLEGIFGISAGTLRDSDPDEADFLLFMHHLTSGNDKVSLADDPEYSLMYPADLPAVPRTLGTTFMPGYGVAFRAHFGSPDETATLFRAGSNKGHWDPDDDLNVILYGKGAPLSPGTGYQYYSGPATLDHDIMHNRVQVEKPDKFQIFGRVENNVQDYGFNDSVDYAVGRVYYPPEQFADKREMEWRRHIVFVKSDRPDGANYFVMRDTVPGGQGRPTWWNWLILDGPENISQTGSDIEMKTKYGAGTHFWFAGAPLPGRATLTWSYNFGPNYHHRAFGKALGVPDQDDKETKTIYQLTGRPGEDYFYVVYPHKDNEALPAFSQPGPGCIKVVTAESTDYVFASDIPLDFEQEGVTFTGKAGAVRVYPDRVVLSMNSGSGRIGYKGAVVEGFGPFERTLPLAGLTPGITHLQGGYDKKIVSQDLGQGVVVTGEAPFEASIVGNEIHVHTTGRKRVIQVTRPAFIGYPMMTLDGQEWRIGMTDYPNSGWGTFKNTNMMAFTTLDGAHDVVIRQRVIPSVWDKEFTPIVNLNTDK